jgi:hypothetical protein
MLIIYSNSSDVKLSLLTERDADKAPVCSSAYAHYVQHAQARELLFQ